MNKTRRKSRAVRKSSQRKRRSRRSTRKSRLRRRSKCSNRSKRSRRSKCSNRSRRKSRRSNPKRGNPKRGNPKRGNPKRGKSRFSIVPPSDYNTHRDYKKLTGHFLNPCSECKEEWRVYTVGKHNGIGFKPERLEWMKELCTDCAELTCDSIMKARKLGVKVDPALYKECEEKLSLAERTKMVLNESRQKR